MEKLSKKDEKRVMDALQKCAAETKDLGEDAEKIRKVAYDILQKDLGDKPELIKRACAAYNSAKTLYKFGNADFDRGDSFCILNGQEMSDRARQAISSNFINKAASANGVTKARFTEISNEPMQKVASADETPKHAWKESSIPMRKLNSVDAYREATAFTEDMAACLHKIARDRDEAIKAVEDAEERFISAMATETPAMRKQAAEMMCNAYGELGTLLVELFNASRGQQKIASYNPNKYKGSVRLPDTILFKSASAVLEAHAMKHVADKMQESCLKGAVEYAKDVFSSQTGIKKEAAGGAALGAGISDIARYAGLGALTEKLMPTEGQKSEADLENEINTTDLVNTLKQHSIKRAFMNTVTDSTVTKYPLHQVVKAFNEALSELPVHMRDLPPTAFTALLKSRTIARLGRGGATSGSDVDQIQQMQQAFSRVRPSDVTSYGKRD